MTSRSQEVLPDDSPPGQAPGPANYLPACQTRCREGAWANALVGCPTLSTKAPHAGAWPPGARVPGPSCEVLAALQPHSSAWESEAAADPGRLVPAERTYFELAK